ncbi:hypothetical protein X733_29730 [Mesorhizobium sp. L2C067A000]|nr:hypothetical protein X733_29730 [Mesorhizobium sp. L2C067A000]
MSELRHVAAHIPLIIPDSDASVGMDDEIIPRRHLLVEFMLAWIPVRRDVSVGRTEDYENLIAIGDFLPDWILAGNMAIEDALVSLRAVELKGDVVRVEDAFAVGDQDAERVSLDKLEQGVLIGDGKMGRNVQR